MRPSTMTLVSGTMVRPRRVDASRVGERGGAAGAGFFAGDGEARPFVGFAAAFFGEARVARAGAFAADFLFLDGDAAGFAFAMFSA